MNSEYINLMIKDDEISISLTCDKNKLKQIKYFDTMFNYKENSDKEIIINVSNAQITWNIINKYLKDNVVKNPKWLDLIEILKQQYFLMLDLESKKILDKLICTNIPEDNYIDLLKEVELIPYTNRLGKLLIRKLPDDFNMNLLPKFFMDKFIQLAKSSYNIITVDDCGKIKKWSSLNLKLINEWRNNNLITFARVYNDNISLICNNNRSSEINFYDLNGGEIMTFHSGEKYFGIDFCPINNKCAICTRDDKYIMPFNTNIYSPINKLFGFSNAKKLERDDYEVSHPFSTLGYVDYIPIKYFPDGLSIVSVTKNKNISVWDTSNNKLIYHINTKNEILNLACSPNNKIFASCGDDKNITLWNRENGHHIKTLSGHSAQISCISFSSDGQYLVSGSNDKIIKLWDVENGQILRTFKGHINKITHVYFSPDDKDIISTGWDKSIKIWNIKTGKLTGEIKNYGLILDIGFKYEPDDNVLKNLKVNNI
ncbi:hypothetical protein QJ854_gp057 [Moumouvirus goulette]|uniref:Uncharacterized protein n=1 Tax=Moumouvirus goulette TaxID=1247379 RepID=M1NNT0_9VIRU|nr:hypothetical protein QJ854_gp057 [Moumouvirus goulette]AGF85725.1 hypothetical protein glt_00922 [Moumouvirus goulette]